MKKIEKLVAKAAMGVAKVSANSACTFIYHQPQAVKELKSLRK